MGIKMKNQFLFGAKDGVPIALGYFAVSFSFGMAAVAAGVPLWVSVALSALNLTSAGQFSALTLMAAGAPIAEIAVSTLVINIRYLLMSLVLSQKLEKMNIFRRMAVAFGVTDEIFTVASTKPHKVGAAYMAGLIAVPYVGWAVGTLCGGAAGALMGEGAVSALGIGLYAMFIAIVLPAAKNSRAVAAASLAAVTIACVLKWVSIFDGLSDGWAIITASVLSAAAAAVIFPRNEEDM